MTKINKTISLNSKSTVSTEEEETSIITLIQCDYGSLEKGNDENSIQSSSSSSELVDDSDGEIEIITFFKKLRKSDEKDFAINTF